ncbi:MAG: molybdopterin molybdotransferase MoeA [Aigarchaeota archaeon]|nr:molybdopterin molybdotransferase MoeA [Aigarchaeota archaeon]MDW8092364.1 molybdopterin molybdotransferase MoeA [Nitrososphaerota archaeon]
MRHRAIRDFIGLDEVLAELTSHVRQVSDFEVIRPRDAVGRLAYSDVVSNVDRPLYDTSHMDGYAVRSSETKSASHERPVTFRVIGWLGPSERRGRISRGEAFRVHTGAYLPEGADAVIPQEDVKVINDGIEVYREIAPFEYVDRRGSDVEVGTCIVRKGERITPVTAALLETLGILEVKVISRPRVGILTFGSELTDDVSLLSEGRFILNTLGPMVRSMVMALGCEPVAYPIVPDDYGEVKGAVMRALERSDCVLTIGGSSVGDIDILSGVFREVSDTYRQGIKLQPGRVGGFALIRGKPLIILPGLIHSTVNVFNYLAAPVLAGLQGIDHRRYLFKWPATLSEPIRVDKWEDFLKVVWVQRIDRRSVKPLLGESSRYASIAHSDGYIEIKPNVKELREGEAVEVITPSWVKDVDARSLC